MVRGIAMELKNLVAIGHDGKVFCYLVRLHLEDFRQKGAAFLHIADQEVQTNPAQVASETFCIYRFIIHKVSIGDQMVAVNGGFSWRRPLGEERLLRFLRKSGIFAHGTHPFLHMARFKFTFG